MNTKQKVRITTVLAATAARIKQRRMIFDARRAAARFLLSPTPIYGTIAQMPCANVDGDSSVFAAFTLMADARKLRFEKYCKLRYSPSDAQLTVATQVFRDEVWQAWTVQQQQHTRRITQEQADYLASTLL